MTLSLNLRVYKNQLLVYEQDVEGPIELGRQGEGEPPPFEWKDSKLVIATKGENEISRRLFRFEPDAPGSVRFTNFSRGPVALPDGRMAAPKETYQVNLPLPLHLDARGKWAIRLQQTEAASESGFSALPFATAPPRGPDMTSRLPTLAGLSAGGFNAQEVMTWLDALLGVLEPAADSEDLFTQAARATVEMVDLDSAQLLLLDEKGDWKACAEFHSDLGATTRAASRGVLERVRQEKRTFLRLIDTPPGERASLEGVDGAEAVVAAPVLNREGQVIGALYGERRRFGGSPRRAPLTTLEARLVEVVAKGVAAGLARLEQERAAMAARVRFEQFFTPELARLLTSQPEALPEAREATSPPPPSSPPPPAHPEALLQAREATVTVLFCDVRGFSRISERLNPVTTLEWIQDVLEVLSQCVLAQGGVLVDYIGDALLALWGAPQQQDDHADRACTAALRMLASLPELNQRWEATLGEATKLSIGLNTGPAQVGNVGCRTKFKYGALGNTVNLASRVQGVSRHLNCPVLITEATRRALQGEFPARKLATVRVHNIDAPVEVCELLPPEREDWQEACRHYEAALASFERKEFAVAARAMGDWRGRHPDDGPALVLLYRAVRCMVEGALPEHPVWAAGEK